MGEFELLARIRERLPAPGPRLIVGMGDDAAVTVPGGATATSVDAIVEGVHFRRQQATLAQIGRKALATALSDLAAMGAEPGEAYVVLGVPSGLDEDGCIELIDGIAALAKETGTVLAGGDVTRAPALTVAMTVVGHASRPELLVSRAGARPGELLVLTGEIGGAAAGLALLEHPELAATVGAETAARLRARQLEPHPRIAAGQALARAGATAMIDLSDGLGGDARRLAEQSDARMRIEVGALPLANGVAEIAAAAGWDPIELALGGGEDYELLAALPAGQLGEAASALGEAETILAQVGEVLTGKGTEFRLPGGRLLVTGGFDQLR
jgi:thiamine-monophosphate kinase